MAVIIERSISEGWLSNTYLVADEEAGEAVMIDAGGPVAALLELISGRGLSLTQILLTHHHHDHVAELDTVLARHPGTPVLIHPLERDHVPAATGALEPGSAIRCGQVELVALHTPGHTAGMISLLAGGTDVFTGDTLFKGSVGGVRAPGHTTYGDLQALDHGDAADTPAGDAHPPRPHRSDHGRRGARAQPLRPDLARARP